jgi:hypothetical protein
MIQPQFNFLKNPCSFAFIRGHFSPCSPWFIVGSGLSGLGFSMNERYRDRTLSDSGSFRG